MEWFIMAVLLLGAIGLAEVLIWTERRFLEPKKVRPVTVTLCLEGHVENMEQLLRYYDLQMRRGFLGFDGFSLVLEDWGMDRETRKICTLFLQKHPWIRLTEPLGTGEK